MNNGFKLNYQKYLKHLLPRIFIMPTKLPYTTEHTYFFAKIIRLFS